jgi:hypothetical protein
MTDISAQDFALARFGQPTRGAGLAHGITRAWRGFVQRLIDARIAAAERETLRVLRATGNEHLVPQMLANFRQPR